MNLLEQVKFEAVRSTELIFEAYENINLYNKKNYANWLAQTFYYVRQVTRVLTFAAGKCDLDKDLEYHKMMLDSANEEGSHGVMATNDLKNLGFSLEEFPELMQTRNFFESLMYNIENYGPYALIGYFAPQEGMMARTLGPLCDNLTELYGEECTEFFRVHAKLDIEHFGESLKFFETCNENQLKAILAGIRRSTELYIDLIKNVEIEKTSSKTKEAPSLRA